MVFRVSGKRTILLGHIEGMRIWNSIPVTYKSVLTAAKYCLTIFFWILLKLKLSKNQAEPYFLLLG